MHTIYIADTLPSRFPAWTSAFQKALRSEGVENKQLSPTKDIWCRDYMPVQNGKGELVQFVYRPDYIMKYASRRKTISDTDQICKNLGLDPIQSALVVDGGNVVLHQRKAILCDKVFRENKQYSREEVIIELKRLLQSDQLIFIPEHPDDEIGHADGMVRWVNANTVLVNAYSNEPDFRYAVETVLINAGLKIIRLPYNPYNNKSYLDATGIYINYLQLSHHILFSVFGMSEDETALKMISEVFCEYQTVPINCNELAKEGGLLNCIIWQYS